MSQTGETVSLSGLVLHNAGGKPQQKLCKGKRMVTSMAELALARCRASQRADAQHGSQAAMVPGPGIQANLPPVLPTQTGDNYAPGLGCAPTEDCGRAYNDFMDGRKPKPTRATYTWYIDKL